MADDPVIQTFIIECSELLQAMEDALLQLENEPEDEETINALFRSAHTIKGSSGIVGFEDIERFTHKVENVLEQVRSGKITVHDELIELLLKCRDHIAGLVEFAAAKEPAGEASMANEEGLLRRLQAFLPSMGNQPETGTNATTHSLLGAYSPNSLYYPHPSPLSPDKREEVRELFHDRQVETGNWHISLRFGQDVLRNGMDPISFINYLSRLGEIVSLTTITDAIPPAEDMDPESCYLGFEIDFRSDFDKQTIEDVFEFVREDCNICILPPHSRIEEYVRLINDLPESPLNLGDILMKGGALTQSELEEALQIQNTETASCAGKQGENRRRIGEIVIDEKMVHRPVVNAALEKQKEQRASKSREAATIRVDTKKFDQLLNLVGELVIANANINQHAQRIGDINLHESASALSRLVEDIRERAMQVRMLPIGEVFSRFQRVVRDVSRDSNKNIELIINGGETELDKNLVEKINDPLMHLVRNSADHGIESPDVRRAKGKPEKGTVRLNAFQDTGCIVIEVADDGGGLNRDRIMKKAVERGLVGPGQTLSDKEIYKLIFEPGFSTAEKVTNVSGRGVGMDVVRRNIDALRGTVDVESVEGEGTTVSIRLPLTLAIIDGFMVGVGASSYIIPLDMVVECIELADAERQATYKRNYVNLRGEVMPYLRLRNLFNENGKKPVYENIVVVKSAGHKIGLVVDMLHGEVQAVIKSLGRIYRDVNGVSGATILGDGTVALILDVPSLVKTVEMEEAVKSVN